MIVLINHVMKFTEWGSDKMDAIFKDNLVRYREYLGPDRFKLWVKEKLFEGKKGDLPFSFGTRYDFGDILKGIYELLNETERVSMRWALSQASKDWDIERHGFYVLRRLYEWGLIIESMGVFNETLSKIERWAPLPEDYLNIIEFGKIADELCSASVRFNDRALKDTPFATIAEHFRDIIIHDEDGCFKLIYSPLFRLGCFADLDDWSRLASFITKRYPYNKDKDAWPEECARMQNCCGKKGFFDLQATLKTVASQLLQLDSRYLLKGCSKMWKDYTNIGGLDCCEEYERMEVIKIVEDEEGWKIILHPRFLEQEKMHNIKKAEERNFEIAPIEGYPLRSKISTSSKTSVNQMINKEEGLAVTC